MSAQGGTPEPFTTLDADASEAAHYSPDILPDGDVLFTVLEGSGVNRIAIKLSAESNHRILLDGRHPRYVPTGHLVFMRTGSLWAVPFDVDALALSGTPAPVLEGVSSGAGMGQFALALDGSLAYVPGGNTTVPTLVWVDREGREEPVPAEPRDYSGLRISPDGRRVAISSSDSGPPDVEVYDLVRNTPTRLTFAPEGDSYPTWSRDGAHVAFASARDGVLNPYWKAADGTGEVERLATYDGALAVHSWSGDGSVAVVSGLRQETGLNIGLLSMDGTGAIEWVLDEEYDESYPDVSPDGRWMAYISNESGQFEVYVRPFPNVDDGRYQISRDGGLSPVWGPDGRELFFLSALSSAGQTTVMTVAVDTDPTFAAGIPSPLFEGPYRTLVPPSQEPWDISPDGERFLMMKEVQRAAGTGRVIVVHNWVEELTRLVPVP